jgi:hypothetical protein
LDFLKSLRPRLFLDYRNPALIYRDACDAYGVAKEFHGVGKELAFLEARIQGELPKSLKHFAQVSYVLLTRIAIDEDIVQVYYAVDINQPY